MPMSPRLLRPIASGVHPEAKVWQNAVIANGGTVSAGTMKAVSDFCRSIDAAGIRDRFYRLSLMCGDNLNAVTVPLYRGPSRAGTQYGNAADTNTGPFVSGDYSESVGLSAGSSSAGKYLQTGFTMNSLPTTNIHVGVWFKQSSGTGHPSSRHMGASQSGQTWTASGFVDVSLGQTGAGSSATASGMAVGSRAASNSAFLYLNGVLDGTNTQSTAPSLPAIDFWVFQVNNSGSPIGFQTSIGPIIMYSAGLHLDSQQAADFYTAANTFKVALGR